MYQNVPLVIFVPSIKMGQTSNKITTKLVGKHTKLNTPNLLSEFQCLGIILLFNYSICMSVQFKTTFELFLNVYKISR